MNSADFTGVHHSVMHCPIPRPSAPSRITVKTATGMFALRDRTSPPSFARHEDPTPRDRESFPRPMTRRFEASGIDEASYRETMRDGPRTRERRLAA